MTNFDIVGVRSNSTGRGVVFLNDWGKKSDFVFADWGVPIIRPKFSEVAKDLSDMLSDVSLSDTFSDPNLDELAGHIVEKLKKCQNLQQDVFFIIVSFDQNLSENFSLRFSWKSRLLSPIEKNFLHSKQSFEVINSHTNVLFKKIESSVSGVSCFELCFGSSIEKSEEGIYSKERVFEEALIFASLAVTKMI